VTFSLKKLAGGPTMAYLFGASVMEKERFKSTATWIFFHDRFITKRRASHFQNSSLSKTLLPRVSPKKLFSFQFLEKT